MTPLTMTRRDIISALEEHPFVDIFQISDSYAVVYDQSTATDITYYFPERYLPQHLMDKIHICPDMPSSLQIDKNTLTAYLWETMDHNAFLTLSGLWYVCSDEDYRFVARFHQCDEAVLLPNYDALGCMWYARQVCIVDVGRILKRLQKQHHRYQADPDFDPVVFLRKKLLITTLHELRHLMLDTNPALPTDAYPIELGGEFFVERYAQEVYAESDSSQVFV